MNTALKLSPGRIYIWILKSSYWNSKLAHRLRRWDLLFKANEFRDPNQRQQHINSRILIYKIIKKYKKNELDTHKLTLNYGKKPVARIKNKKISISISHSEKIIAVAAKQNGRIGIDTETLPKLKKITKGVSRYIYQCTNKAPSDLEIWETWCRQEALLKTLGIGIQGLRYGPLLCSCQPASRFCQHPKKISSINIQTIKKNSNLIIACASDKHVSKFHIHDVKII